MDIRSLLSPERTHSSLAATSKKKAIQEAARRIALTSDTLDSQEIFDSLIAREKIGTTAIGHGIAIPHCRVASCSTIVGSLFRLDHAIDFDANDNEPVRLLFVLLVPIDETEEHLQALSLLASRFESSGYRKRLFEARDDDALFEAAVADVSNIRTA